MTQLEQAKKGIVTEAMKSAAAREGSDAALACSEIAAGRAVLPANPAHSGLKPWVVGRAFRTKINANIGISSECSNIKAELLKLKAVADAKAEFVMDLSIGPKAAEIRKKMLEQSQLPLGTVPLYEAFGLAGGKSSGLTGKIILKVIRAQAEQGVDFMTIHAGLLAGHLPAATRRRMGIVSRGGAILAEWMITHKKENPCFTMFDEILDICRTHDVTISLGDGLRPGCLADASDEAQFAELDTLGELVLRCRKHGVQVMVEGPGHVPLNEVKMNMEREQERCHGAPFYVLGPVVTDIAPGYDHITSAIGAASAAQYGASLLCYVTPSEHLALPSLDDVKAGIVAHLIAAHAGDIARKLPGARKKDDEMADARASFNWNRQFELAIDGETARRKFEEHRSRPTGSEQDFCSMCGKEFCAVRTTNRVRAALDSGKKVPGASK
jgi:phosphomethylpyrimidine synthase